MKRESGIQLYTGLLVLLLFLITGRYSLAQTYRILPLGNSITEGNDATSPPTELRASYRDRLYDLLTGAGYSFDFVGHNNTGTELVPDGDHGGISGSRGQYVVRLLQDGFDLRNEVQITPSEDPYLDHWPADIVLLHIGTNDITHGEGSGSGDVADILNEIDNWEAATGNHVTVFIARIIKRTDEPTDSLTTIQYNDNVAAMVAGSPGILMVDIESGAGIDYASEMLADGIHPTQSAYDKMGDRWFSSLDAYLSEIPVPPTDLTVGRVRDRSIELTWNDASGNETGFEIERSLTPSGGDFIRVHTTGANGTSYTDNGLNENTQYYYRIRAINTTGPSLYTSVVSASTITYPPAAPTAFRGIPTNVCSVSLSWTDNSDNEEGFRITRSLNQTTGFELIEDLDSNLTSYIDTETVNNNTYYYRIEAFNAAGTSIQTSATVNVNIVLNGGTIGPDQSLCASGDSALINSIMAPSGGSDNWTYHWQSRVPPDPFADIIGATGLTYVSPAGLLQTTEYQRVATVECGTVYSNTVTITMEDNEAPVFTTCPSDIQASISRDHTAATVNTPDPVLLDNCGIQLLTWTLSGATSGSSPEGGTNNLGTHLFNLGETTVTYYAEDLTGNSAICSFTVTLTPEVSSGKLPTRSDNLLVYPNPAKDLVNIYLGDPSRRDGNLQLVDLNGRLVRVVAIWQGQQKTEISIGELDRGMYFLQWIESDSLREWTKLVKVE